MYLSIRKIVVYAPTGLSRFQNPDFFLHTPGRYNTIIRYLLAIIFINDELN